MSLPEREISDRARLKKIRDLDAHARTETRGETPVGVSPLAFGRLFKLLASDRFR